MTSNITIGEGVFEIHYLQDFSRVTKYRKDYELFVIRFYPENDLPEEGINELFLKNKKLLFDAIDLIIDSHRDFFSYFRIEKIMHGDFCMKNYNALIKRNVITCYMKKLKFVALDRQKLPVV
jgi:hypothetical protein